MTQAAKFIDGAPCFDALNTKQIDQVHNFNTLNMLVNGEVLGSGERFDNGSVMAGDIPKLEKTFEEGVEIGRQSAQESMQDLESLVEALQTSLSDIQKSIEIGHSRAVCALLSAALPALAKANISREISDFLISTAACTLGGAIELTVNPEFEEALENLVTGLEYGLNKRCDFTITVDSKMRGKAVNAVWQGGNASIDIEQAVAEIISHTKSLQPVTTPTRKKSHG